MSHPENSAEQTAKLTLNANLDALAQQDVDIAAAIAAHGRPAPRLRANNFATLMQIIVSQQLSTKAAAAIWQRVEQFCNSEVTPNVVLAASDQALRDCGLSWRKVEYSKLLATQIDSGAINLQALAQKPTDEIIATLTQIKGFGRWSAEIYAMFSLGHSDVLPAADLALQIAIGRVKGLPEKPSEQQARQLAEAWSPHRTAASLLLWHYYGAATLD